MAFAGEYPKIPSGLAFKMKIFLIIVTIGVFSFSAVSGAAIHIISEMQTMKGATATYLGKSLKDISQIEAI